MYSKFTIKSKNKDKGRLTNRPRIWLPGLAQIHLRLGERATLQFNESLQRDP